MLQLANARRDLSRLMGEDNTSEFLVEMGLSLDMNLDLKTLEQQLQAQNTIIALNEEQVNQAEIDIKLAQAAYRPLCKDTQTSIWSIFKTMPIFCSQIV